jgi:Xaa-Pro aminopeptidase
MRSAVGPKVLESHACDAWLVYDYRGSNPVFANMLGETLTLSRRTFLLFTPEGEPRLLVSQVDYTDELPERFPNVRIERYASWKQLESWLAEHLAKLRTVAMEYSPDGALPNMSWTDGGTLDLVRAQGVEVVSSAEIFQEAAARWTAENLESHRRAMDIVVGIKDAAFEQVASRLRAGEACDERLIQEFIESEFARDGLVTDDPPIVSVNAHSGNPHYAPAPGLSAPIEKGDWLLIDLWAREEGPNGIFADITWVGYLGRSVPERHAAVFDVVAAARDVVVDRLENQEGVQGYELDRAARDLIEEAGYGKEFVHRTGHSLSSGDSVHGLGANLDDYETHDTRPLVPGLGFTIEPGVYLEEFGVRSEINVYMSEAGPVVTSPTQTAPLTFDL